MTLLIEGELCAEEEILRSQSRTGAETKAQKLPRSTHQREQEACDRLRLRSHRVHRVITQRALRGRRV
jgi:hypothetical protein